MLTDKALQASNEAKRAAAIAYLGAKHVLANPLTRDSIRDRRAQQAAVPVLSVYPLVDALAEGEICIVGPGAHQVTTQLNRAEQAIRGALDAAAR